MLHVWDAAMVKKAVDFLKFVHKINRFGRFLGKCRLVDANVEFLEGKKCEFRGNIISFIMAFLHKFYDEQN